MERNGLSITNLKDHSLGGRTMKDNKNGVRDSWDSTSESHGGGDLLGGFLWPPRSYTCTFCKREFRSAQALGGHMNVHRRERARLRQSPPTPRDGQYSFLNLNLNLNPNPNPNPNPNFSSSSSSPSARFPPFSTSTLPPLVSPLSSLSLPSQLEAKKWSIGNASGEHLSKRVVDLRKMKTSEAHFGIGEGTFRREGECNILKKAEIVKLDLEYGLLSDSNEDLDLELRLGYS